MRVRVLGGHEEPVCTPRCIYTRTQCITRRDGAATACDVHRVGEHMQPNPNGRDRPLRSQCARLGSGCATAVEGCSPGTFARDRVALGRGRESGDERVQQLERTGVVRRRAPLMDLWRTREHACGEAHSGCTELGARKSKSNSRASRGQLGFWDR